MGKALPNAQVDHLLLLVPEREAPTACAFFSIQLPTGPPAAPGYKPVQRAGVVRGSGSGAARSGERSADGGSSSGGGGGGGGGRTHPLRGVAPITGRYTPAVAKRMVTDMRTTKSASAPGSNPKPARGRNAGPSAPALPGPAAVSMCPSSCRCGCPRPREPHPAPPQESVWTATQAQPSDRASLGSSRCPTTGPKKVDRKRRSPFFWFAVT